MRRSWWIRNRRARMLRPASPPREEPPSPAARRKGGRGRAESPAGRSSGGSLDGEAEAAALALGRDPFATTASKKGPRLGAAQFRLVFHNRRQLVQAAAALGRPARKPETARPARPRPIIAQVDGSGTSVTVTLSTTVCRWLLLIQ